METTAQSQVPEPLLVRSARRVLASGYQHIDNLTGGLVNEMKVERAKSRAGYPVDEYDEVENLNRNDESPILIKRSRGGQKINPVLLDAFTASMIVQIYDAINDANKAKFAPMVEKFGCSVWIGKLWKLVK